MTALTNQHDAAAEMLTNNCKKLDERTISVNLSMFSSQSGLQMSIEVGIEKGKTMYIQKSNNGLLEIIIADFSIVRIYPIELLSPTAFARYWMLQKWMVQGSHFQVGRKLEVSYFFIQSFF